MPLSKEAQEQVRIGEIIRAANSKEIGHFYTPIAFFNGGVLKYQGIATEANKDWFIEKNPGTIILPERITDRIYTLTHQPYRD